ncbi:hypothetical protein KKE34_05465 [Patescibacteria group bacterium]|nr:hypothetical protein [Patescibacteria group bacterium]MBU1886020.1 hypothetical protein [Patescibacteria group bacterium]
MKLRYILVCLSVLIGLVFYLQLARQEQKTQATFSPVAANPTNLVDIGKLTLEDYKHISEESGVVFVSKKDSQKQIYFDDKQLQSLEMSPSQKQVAFSYNPNETEELKENELSLMLLDLDSKKVKEIFHTTFPSWDVAGNPDWLGNNHLVFVRHCGTSCQGLTLLNIQTGELKNATLSYMSSFSDRPVFTHFEDWFNTHFELDGFVKQIFTEFVGGKYYLVFDMQTDIGEEINKKKFLFLENNLALES